MLAPYSCICVSLFCKSTRNNYFESVERLGVSKQGNWMCVTDSYCGLICDNIAAFSWTDWGKQRRILNVDTWQVASKITSSAGRTETLYIVQNFVLVWIFLGHDDASNKLNWEDILRLENVLQQRGKWINLVLSWLYVNFKLKRNRKLTEWVNVNPFACGLRFCGHRQ